MSQSRDILIKDIQAATAKIQKALSYVRASLENKEDHFIKAFADIIEKARKAAGNDREQDKILDSFLTLAEISDKAKLQKIELDRQNKTTLLVNIAPELKALFVGPDEIKSVIENPFYNETNQALYRAHRAECTKLLKPALLRLQQALRRGAVIGGAVAPHASVQIAPAVASSPTPLSLS